MEKLDFEIMNNWMESLVLNHYGPALPSSEDRVLVDLVAAYQLYSGAVTVKLYKFGLSSDDLYGGALFGGER